MSSARPESARRRPPPTFPRARRRKSEDTTPSTPERLDRARPSPRTASAGRRPAGPRNNRRDAARRSAPRSAPARSPPAPWCARSPRDGRDARRRNCRSRRPPCASPAAASTGSIASTKSEEFGSKPGVQSCQTASGRRSASTRAETCPPSPGRVKARGRPSARAFGVGGTLSTPSPSSTSLSPTRHSQRSRTRRPFSVSSTTSTATSIDVADLDRPAKIEGLRDIDRARARQPHADHRRDQARGVEPVHDAAAEPGLAREMLGEMDRIVVARQFGEADDVLVLDRLAQRLAHAERELLEIVGLERRLSWPTSSSPRSIALDARATGQRCDVQGSRDAGVTARARIAVANGQSFSRAKRPAAGSAAAAAAVAVQFVAVNAGADEQRVEPLPRGAGDVGAHRVADRQHARAVDRPAAAPPRPPPAAAR